jgi:hypothetical protein
VAAITARTRARTTLTATTALNPADVLAAVKQATDDAKGGGGSLLTSGIVNAAAQVHVEKELPDGLAMSITSGKRLVELCTFSAFAEAKDGTTSLRVGGLETYKTSQTRVLGVIPAGPAAIPGFSLYKRFLGEVEARLKANDPQATVSIAVPES